MAVLEADTPAQVLTAGLAQVRQLLAGLVQIDLHDLDGGTVLAALDAVEQVRRQGEALAARALAVVEADGMWALDGARSMAAWYRARTGKHHASAAREIRLARALRDHLPATAAALATGQISADHATALVRHTTTTDARRALLKDPGTGEALLLTHARTLDATDFAVAAQRWGQQADPDAADRAYRADSTKEEFYLSATTGGYVPGGWLSEASGKAVLAALTARVGTPAKGDTRSAAHRRAGALTSLAHLVLDSGVLRPGARIRPHLAVTVPFETLQRLIAAAAPTHRPGCTPTGNFPGAAFGLPPQPATPGGALPVGAGEPALTGPAASGLTGAAGAAGAAAAGAGADAADVAVAGCTCGADQIITADLDLAQLHGAEPATFDDGVVIAPALLGRLACASHMHRVIFGPDSEVLDLGREERIFTAAQTRAIIARDKRCQYPHCNAPPGEGEIHHSIWWWAQFGSTNIRLGVLLCWFHHDYVHTHHINIERRHGQWIFTRPDGTTISHNHAAA
ncbi:DUF222 domain-containing protein [Georgenia yuyongxinii]|uniref:DUF222 domain-containing protein n=1 Tax=Georgenia yuyongxinii TaxID=2589797 RepID=A0A5B8C3U5_9MICO|nr:HNH endonuclease signature motif containing protein [Georgenia yuyongxinii]QDC25224.1 DUF222 domain-containing protein [Georgenia yuyongxinii]